LTSVAYAVELAFSGALTPKPSTTTTPQHATTALAFMLAAPTNLRATSTLKRPLTMRRANSGLAQVARTLQLATSILP